MRLSSGIKMIDLFLVIGLPSFVVSLRLIFSWGIMVLFVIETFHLVVVHHNAMFWLLLLVGRLSLLFLAVLETNTRTTSLVTMGSIWRSLSVSMLRSCPLLALLLKFLSQILIRFDLRFHNFWIVFANKSLLRDWIPFSVFSTVWLAVMLRFCLPWRLGFSD